MNNRLSYCGLVDARMSMYLLLTKIYLYLLKILRAKYIMSTLTTQSCVSSSILKRHLVLSRDFYETFRSIDKMVRKFSTKVTKTWWNLPPDLMFTSIHVLRIYVIMFWNFLTPSLMWLRSHFLTLTPTLAPFLWLCNAWMIP